jgi:hypothetical protein
MPGWLTALLMWGGSAVTIVSAVDVVLIVAGLAAAIVGWLLQRRKGSSGS